MTHGRVTEFAQVEAHWLDLLWTLDAYRVASVVPREMGNAADTPGSRLSGVYRQKGNWYAEMVAILLGNRTSQQLAPRSRIEGFSQWHQIDVAWPARDQNPLVCLETKVTGAPAYGTTPARSALSDWSNRRKELKFAATDLKLWRRSWKTEIGHWDEWRAAEEPACFFLWGARVTARDSTEKMVREVQALTKTYLDGAAIFAWRPSESNDKYVPVSITTKDLSDRVSTIDDMLARITGRIRNSLTRGGQPPEPVIGEPLPVDLQELEPDRSISD